MKKQRSTKTKAMDADHPAVITAAAKQAEAKKIAAVLDAILTRCPPPILPKILPTRLSITWDVLVLNLPPPPLPQFL
jgi:hypothetical protein